jgi:hypothetical protein
MRHTVHCIYPIAPYHTYIYIYQDQQQMNESSDITATTALPTGTTPTGKRMGPLSFTANSKVDPTKHRSRSQSISEPPIDEADYADEVMIDYDAIRKSIAEAINYSMNSGIIFRYCIVERSRHTLHALHTHSTVYCLMHSEAW